MADNHFYTVNFRRFSPCDDACGVNRVNQHLGGEEADAVPHSATAANIPPHSDHQSRTAVPEEAGKPPFTRGPYAGMYQRKPWTIRQYTGFASAVASNAAFRQTLAEGGQGLSVAFDLPTHLGFDSDDEAASADVGRCGVAIDSVEDMKRLFAGIPLDQVSVSMTMNGAVLPILAAYIVAAEENGVARQHLRGTIQNDILKEFMVRNTYIFAPEFSLRICTDVVEYLSRELPSFNAMSISGYHFQEAGADPALELALTIANGLTYVQAVARRGLDPDQFCHRLSFFFGVGMAFFTEIAKLRAAPRLWCEEVTKLGATTDQARRLKMHCQTSGWSLTAQQPLNNLVRTTIEAMAAVFGGTQSLHTNAYDEALSIPTDESARLARNTQLILQEEAGLCDAVDPWGGSYMMESLTEQIVVRVREYLAEIDQQGGVIAAIHSGWVSERIHQAASRTQADMDAGRRAIVGVTRHVQHNEQPAPSVRQINTEALLGQQRQHLQQLRRSRDPQAVSQCLSRLQKAANNEKDNLLELTIAAVRARATLGECTQALLRVQPRYRTPQHFQPDSYGAERRADTHWHRAVLQVRRYRQHTGRAPRILLLKLGLDGHDRGVRVVAAALASAGFSVCLEPLFCSVADAIKAVAREQPDCVGVSLLSGAHLPLLMGLQQALRASAFAGVPVIAGGVIPAADHSVLKQQGIELIFGPGNPMDAMITDITGLLQRQAADCTPARQRHY